ncbi:cytochrome b [Thalassobium sp. R2A62]|uniref:cytochrome b n=1 Tax=Thalassobium sp. R2A62 TaxID=633131 RepID=UPI0001B1D128|nr:cytochrome b/b6 domain-containing protein [Thalassobium sp. R2A62]EET47161.1 cytochrome B561, putative [Thalassobium sp. R2A62]
MSEATKEQAREHGLIARVFHWGFIVVFVYALLKQLDAIEQLQDPDLLRFEMVFAMGFLALLAVRFTYMRITMPTALPASTSPRLKVLARAGHLAMYLSLATMAISGLAIGAIYSSGSPEGAGMRIAMFFHENAILVAYLSIGLHIAAAVFHRLKGDGIWSSMVPIWKETQN